MVAILMFAAGIALQGVTFFFVLGVGAKASWVADRFAPPSAKDRREVQTGLSIAAVIWIISVGLMFASGRVF